MILPVSAFMDKIRWFYEIWNGLYGKTWNCDYGPSMNKMAIENNNCVMVCPHATIRAFLMTDEEIANAPRRYL